MRRALDALTALSTLLGGGQWFFEQQEPSLFDAAVFAYTHLLLDEEMYWQDNGLGENVKHFENLVQHRERIAQMYH